MVKNLVAEVFGNLVLQGQLRESSFFSERTLSEQTGIPRAKVREAIGAMAMFGIVEQHPKIGSFVTRFNASQVEQILNVRADMEARSVSKLIATLLCLPENEKETFLSPIQEAINAMQEAQEEGNYFKLFRSDLHFHNLVASATHQTYVAEWICNLYLTTFLSTHSRILFDDIKDGNNAIARAIKSKDGAQFVSSHQEVLDAIKSLDTASSERLIRKHITESGACWKEALERSSLT